MLVGRQEEHPACTEWWGAGVDICLERGADCLHMVQLMPLHSQTRYQIILLGDGGTSPVNRPLESTTLKQVLPFHLGQSCPWVHFV